MQGGSMRNAILFCSCLFIMGCVTFTTATNKLNLGMSKQEVIGVLGQPSSIKANDNTEILEYMLSDNRRGVLVQYWVTLKDGRVVQYGNSGDFGNALPQDRRQYDINMH